MFLIAPSSSYFSTQRVKLFGLHLIIYKKFELLFINKILIIIQYREMETKPEMNNYDVSFIQKIKKNKKQSKKELIIAEEKEDK